MATGMTISTITMIISNITVKLRMSSLLVRSAFRGGGAGAIHTDITAAITTATTVPVMHTAVAVGLEWPTYSADSHAPVTTMAPSTGVLGSQTRRAIRAYERNHS